MSRNATDRRNGSLSPLLAGSLVIGVLGLSAVIGRRNAPDPSHPGIRNWYRHLDKPDFTPPDAVFGAVWPILETSIAVGGYRLLRKEASARRNASVGSWLVTTAMIGGWTQIFFRERALSGGAVASSAMLATTAAYVATTRKVDRVAQATAIPLLGWVAFATALSARIWLRNSTPRTTQ